MKKVKLSELKIGDKFKTLPSAYEPYSTIRKIEDNNVYADSSVTELTHIDTLFVYVNESAEYCIGDVVPYKNTRGNIRLAKITSFETVRNNKVWFNGIDTKTNAKVWYPVHISKTLIVEPEQKE